MFRSLSHYWRINLAVVLSCAVACAVLAGALLVGDSVRGSLRDLTLDRLGEIDYALSGRTFFRAGLHEDLAREHGEQIEQTAAAIVVHGSAVHAETGARASQVGVQGVGADFSGFFAPSSESSLIDLSRAEGQRFPSVVVNEALRRELGADIGDDLLVALERPGQAPRETLLGSTATEDVVRELRLTLVAVLLDRGVGRFSLQPSQELPLVAFVDLGVLQSAIEQEDRANTLLIAAGPEDRGDLVDDLQASLRRALSVEDLGLEISVAESWIEVLSRDHILSPTMEELLVAFGDQAGVSNQPILTYLANRLEVDGRSVPYSSITAFRTDVEPAFGALRLVDGSAAPALGSREVLVNEWLAADLDAAIGDEILVTYYEVGPREELTTRTEAFHIRGVVALEGLGADRSLTPDFPGIQDAENMADWDPPFPIDLGEIREQDEEYWDLYRGTPKAFFALEDGRALWTTRFGNATALRFASATMPAADLADEFRENFASSFDPSRLGLVFEAVKARGLAASAGATDFRMLFVSFSFFLIASAALLVALFFGLGVEQRASEMGLLSAIGWPQRAVRRRFLAEGAVLSIVGVLLGLLGAVLYAGAMMALLRSWWQAAVGTSFLYLHVEPMSLVWGGLGALVVSLLSIAAAMRRMRRVSAVALLRGVVAERGRSISARGARRVFVVSASLAVLTLAVGAAWGAFSSPVVFFPVGGCLLIAGLAFLALRFVQPRSSLEPSDRGSLIAMAVRNASLNPSRSLLSAGLVASASFVIVAVAVNGFRYSDEVWELDSPAGGYALVAESEIPLHVDLENADALSDLGFSDSASELLAQTEITAFRALPGDDVSCLNLYQPESPRILGVPVEQQQRGGFRFKDAIEEREDPWSLLSEEMGDVVPAFADGNSAQWILKLGLGDELEVENERGETVRLRLVGLLEKGLFQSEILISEQNFKKHFPSRTGYSFFLFDPPEGRFDEVSELLESRLGAYGFDITPTQERLQRFEAVQNTYLATFQTLGGLGLLLGTLGLAAILLRNVMERRGELATLRALGFRRRSLGWLVVAENSLLLVVGVAIGSLAALVAVAPHLLSDNALVPWGSLILTLLAILIVGMLACAAAVRVALSTPLLPALKSE